MASHCAYYIRRGRADDANRKAASAMAHLWNMRHVYDLFMEHRRNSNPRKR